MPQTSKKSIAGASSEKTEQLNGTVIAVDGNHLAVRMADGGIRTFNVPESRRFLIDGRELTVGQLKPGTKLTATVTTTTTPITDRTTTVGTGKVWFVSGNTVIITLPNNENRQYKVGENYRFNIGGEKASVHELRKGMTISAEKIVEEPRVEIASNIAVTGEAPPAPSPRVATAPPPVKPSALGTVATPVPAPVEPSAPVAAAPAPQPVHPVEHAEAAPAELPKTASPVPLIGLLGLGSLGASFLVRKLRQV